MLSFARFVLTAGLVVSALGSAQADSGPKDLWSLYLREHSAGLCGRGLSEEQGTELDEAQHLARVRSLVSEAAVLYRRARTVARDALCSSGDDRPIELKEIETRADWSQARPDGALWYPKWYPGPKCERNRQRLIRR